MCAHFARVGLFVVAGIVLIGALCGNPPQSVLIYGITPAEAKSGELVSIRGRLLDQANLVVKFCDLNMTTCYQAALVEQAPHFATVVVPSVPYERTKYYAYVGASGTLGLEAVGGKSRSIYLRGGGAPPTSQAIRLFVGSATWKFVCDEDSDNCGQQPMFPYWYQCWSAWGSDRSHGSWGSYPWSKYRLIVDQAVRDWSTMCSKAWDSSHSKQLASSWIEAAVREEIRWNYWFWLETARDMPLKPCDPAQPGYWGCVTSYNGLLGCTGSGPLYTMATGTTWFWDDSLQYRWRLCERPDDNCSYHGTPLTAVSVFFVGAFFYYGEEVDPNDPTEGFRALAGTKTPALVDGYSLGEPPADTHGLILVSLSPSIGYFPHPSTKGDSVLPLVRAENRCTNENCWPGPGYSDDTTPGVLAHELMHVLTSRHDAPQTSAIEDTIWVQSDRDDGGIYRRGFSLNAPTLKATAQTECAEARAGDGKDFTE